MGIRFQRRIRILPGVYLNFGKTGISISVGPRGVKFTLGRKGVRASVGLPGTGIRYETPYVNVGRRRTMDACQPEGENVRRLREMLEKGGSVMADPGEANEAILLDMVRRQGGDSGNSDSKGKPEGKDDFNPAGKGCCLWFIGIIFVVAFVVYIGVSIEYVA